MHTPTMPFTEQQQADAAASVKQTLWAKLAINHTKKTCAVSCIFPLLSILVILATRSFTLQDPSGQDYFVRDDIRTRLDDARAAARDQFQFSPTFDERTRERDSFGMEILLRGLVHGQVPKYDQADGAPNLLTRHYLALLKRAEDLVFLDDRYRQFCLFDPQVTDCSGRVPACVLPLSILNSKHLYGDYTSDGRLCGRKNGSEPISQQDFDSFFQSLVVQQDGVKVISPAASRFLTTQITPDSLQSWAIRSRLRVGMPFKGYTSVDDQRSQQDKIYDEWSSEIRDTVNFLTTDKVDVFIFGERLANAVFGDIALRDLSFSVAAIVLVFIIIWIHTGSGFLAGTAMAQIFLAFPLAYIFYRLVFRQLYFAALQILAIFLLLGIGADDVFVFTDAWKQAAVVLGDDCDLVTRMSWTYRRAVRAMSVTSVTTAAAFFVTATSPIMPIATLGVWAGLLILLQFFLVITIYPCAVAIWQRFWRQRLFIRCFRKPASEEAEYELHLPFYQRFLPKKWRSNPGDNVSEYRPIERFFRGPWLNLINRARYILVPLAIALTGVSIYLATRLQPPTETEEFLPDSHPMPVAFDTILEAFPTSKADQQLRVRITWGISDVDREGTSKFEPSNPGKVILDGNFDLKTATAQRHLLESCSFFGNNEELIFQGDTIDETVRCWIRDYKQWRKIELNEDDFRTFSSERDLAEELIHFGEFTQNGRQPYIKYLNSQDIAFSADKSKLVFTEMRFVSSTRSAVPEPVMWPVYQRWQKLLAELNANAPNGVNQAIATGGLAWKWQITQRRLVRSMFVGIGVMLGVAFVALAVSTLNWAVAILTTLIIGGIVAMLMGVISLLGWELGITETVGVVISIGYSFDGAAHIATAYVDSHSESRYDRTRDALTDLGISILFGAISTLFAGFMLFPAIITFFVKFAGLIVTTVSLSMIWSLIFLPSLLLIVGPTGNFGSLSPVLRKLIKCFRRRRENEGLSKDDEMTPEAGNAKDKIQAAEEGTGSSEGSEMT